MNQLKFDVLVYLERKQNEVVMDLEVAKWHSIEENMVHEAIKSLIEMNYLKSSAAYQYEVTETAYAFLENYSVKRAIFFSAGFGSRMLPATINMPKPMIRVNGEVIIEKLLDAVLAAGIEDIYIVRGYLKDNLDLLLKKYPMIKFVDNDLYNQQNNISSAYLVKDLLQGALVLESDIVIYDPLVIRKYEYSSNYRSIKREKTKDWCFETKGNIITNVMIGGKDTQEMFGISYWTEKDGIQLEKDISEVYATKEGKNIFWDEVTLTYRKENYEVAIFEVNDKSLVEIDTYAELCALDQSYIVQ